MCTIFLHDPISLPRREIVEKFLNYHVEINISKQFYDIRFEIDLLRQELNRKFDDIVLEMTVRKKVRKKSFLKDLDRANLNTINTDFEEEVKILLG